MKAPAPVRDRAAEDSGVSAGEILANSRWIRPPSVFSAVRIEAPYQAPAWRIQNMDIR